MQELNLLKPRRVTPNSVFGMFQRFTLLILGLLGIGLTVEPVGIPASFGGLSAFMYDNAQQHRCAKYQCFIA
jgi:hypothetical protein